MAEWKKVVLRGDNVSTELLKATDAAVDVANDSIVFADDGDGFGSCQWLDGCVWSVEAEHGHRHQQRP